MAAQTRTPPTSRSLTVGYSPETPRRAFQLSPSPIPYLRLRGHWLRQAGFDVGQKVSIRISDGCITIVPNAAS